MPLQSSLAQRTSRSFAISVSFLFLSGFTFLRVPKTKTINQLFFFFCRDPRPQPSPSKDSIIKLHSRQSPSVRPFTKYNVILSFTLQHHVEFFPARNPQNSVQPKFHFRKGNIQRQFKVRRYIFFHSFFTDPNATSSWSSSINSLNCGNTTFSSLKFHQKEKYETVEPTLFLLFTLSLWNGTPSALSRASLR